MKIEIDTHTHTLASSHAYSTLQENVRYAASIGHKGICMTDHAPLLPDAPHPWHFGCLRYIPEYVEGIRVVTGAEVNVLDEFGHTDLDYSRTEGGIKNYIKYENGFEVIIASTHAPIYEITDKKLNTQMWLNIAKNPYVDIIGHCGADKYAFDYEKVIKEFKKYGKIVEINAHSFDCRPGSEKNCPEIARLCKEYGVPVVLSSDAHICYDIGKVEPAVKKIEEVGLTEKDVLNTNLDEFLYYLHDRQKTAKLR